MSLRYCCDRCNRLIPDSDYYGMRFFHRVTLKGKLTDIIFGDDELEYHKDILLCKECTDGFLEWMEKNEEE